MVQGGTGCYREGRGGTGRGEVVQGSEGARRCIISGVHHGSAGDTLSHKSSGTVISDADSILVL